MFATKYINFSKCYSRAFDPNIITYKNNKKAGTAIVEIRGLGQYDGTKTVTFEIKKKEQEFDVKRKITKNVGDKKFKLDVVRIEGNGAYKYKSSNPKVVKVNKYGTVTIVGGGEAIITITAEETNDYEKKSVDVKISVKYKIKYYLNKGKNNSENPSSYFNQNISLKNPTRKGYIFKGWYTDKNFGKKITKITTKTKKNLTLYAKWKKVKVDRTEITVLKNIKGKKLQLKFDKLKNIDGYQIIYSTDKAFAKNKKMVYTKENTVTIKNLKKNKTYYVKLRAYCVDSTGKRIYGSYSDVESVKIRK